MSSPLQDLPPLRTVIDHHQLWAKKGLGQNFLLDMNLTDKIAQSGGLQTATHIIEIGAGPGGLTRAILKEMHKYDTIQHFYVIERDERCIPILTGLNAIMPNRISIFHGDALSPLLSEVIENIHQNNKGAMIHIIANLPYNIASPLLIKLLEMADKISQMTLMFQYEVATRITATVNDGQYGRLAVLCNWLADTYMLMKIPPDAFVPKPKIYSAVVQFCMRDDVEKKLPLLRDMQGVVQAAFGQRRKIIKKSLKSIFSAMKNLPNGDKMDMDIYERLSINPILRAENLTIAEYERLARYYQQYK